MNRKRIVGLARLLALAAMISLTVSVVSSQKRDVVKPPAETASLPETQQWLIANLTKYASYKTRASSVAISDAKFDGCTFSFIQTRKSGSTSTAVMGATKTINAVKDDVSFDARTIAGEGITVNEHIYPELQIVELRLGSEGNGSDATRVIEITVKREATDGIKAALLQVRRLCSEKN